MSINVIDYKENGMSTRDEDDGVTSSPQANGAPQDVSNINKNIKVNSDSSEKDNEEAAPIKKHSS